MFIFIIINTPICKLNVIKLVISLKIIVYLLPPSKNKWFKLTSILSYSLKKKKKKKSNPLFPFSFFHSAHSHSLHHYKTS